MFIFLSRSWRRYVLLRSSINVPAQRLKKTDLRNKTWPFRTLSDPIASQYYYYHRRPRLDHYCFEQTARCKKSRNRWSSRENWEWIELKLTHWCIVIYFLFFVFAETTSRKHESAMWPSVLRRHRMCVLNSSEGKKKRANRFTRGGGFKVITTFANRVERISSTTRRGVENATRHYPRTLTATRQ